jgi:hypothetical protein
MNDKYPRLFEKKCMNDQVPCASLSFLRGELDLQVKTAKVSTMNRSPLQLDSWTKSPRTAGEWLTRVEETEAVIILAGPGFVQLLAYRLNDYGQQRPGIQKARLTRRVPSLLSVVSPVDEDIYGRTWAGHDSLPLRTL